MVLNSILQGLFIRICCRTYHKCSVGESTLWVHFRRLLADSRNYCAVLYHITALAMNGFAAVFGSGGLLIYGIFLIPIMAVGVNVFCLRNIAYSTNALLTTFICAVRGIYSFPFAPGMALGNNLCWLLNLSCTILIREQLIADTAIPIGFISCFCAGGFPAFHHFQCVLYDQGSRLKCNLVIVSGRRATDHNGIAASRIYVRICAGNHGLHRQTVTIHKTRNGISICRQNTAHAYSLIFCSDSYSRRLNHKTTINFVMIGGGVISLLLAHRHVIATCICGGFHSYPILLVGNGKSIVHSKTLGLTVVGLSLDIYIGIQDSFGCPNGIQCNSPIILSN